MRLFVFDIDGTITNSVPAHHRSFEKAFGDVGITDVDKNWSGYTHHTDSWIFAEVFRKTFGRDPTPQEKNEFARALNDNFEAELVAEPLQQMPGALEFIRRIAADVQSGYAFATGSFRKPAVRKLTTVGLEFPHDLLVSADEFETRDDIVSAAIAAARKYFGVAEFLEVVSIGDGYWDLLTARNLKLEFVGIAAGANGEKLRAAGAVNVFADFLAPGITTSWTARAARDVPC